MALIFRYMRVVFSDRYPHLIGIAFQIVDLDPTSNLTFPEMLVGIVVDPCWVAAIFEGTTFTLWKGCRGEYHLIGGRFVWVIIVSPRTVDGIAVYFLADLHPP